MGRAAAIGNSDAPLNTRMLRCTYLGIIRSCNKPSASCKLPLLLRSDPDLLGTLPRHASPMNSPKAFGLLLLRKVIKKYRLGRSADRKNRF
jgi:hypothetical protein